MKLWEDVRPLLLPALDGAGEPELIASLARGKAQLWVGQGAAMVTEVTATRTCHVWLAGGEMQEILRLRPGVEAWARGLGCTRATIDGRKGWARVLGPFGYRQVGEQLRKNL